MAKFSAFVSDDLIEDFFYCYNDKVSKKIFYGDNLEEIKIKMTFHYEVEDVKDEDGKSLKSGDEKFKNILNEIKEKDLEKIEIKLQKPNYALESSILSESVFLDKDGIPQINYVVYNRLRLTMLLKDWNLEDNDGKVTVSATNLGKLCGEIIEVLILKINKHVGHRFGILSISS
jgi:hypothetical protein